MTTYPHVSVLEAYGSKVQVNAKAPYLAYHMHHQRLVQNPAPESKEVLLTQNMGVKGGYTESLLTKHICLLQVRHGNMF